MAYLHHPIRAAWLKSGLGSQKHQVAGRGTGTEVAPDRRAILHVGDKKAKGLSSSHVVAINIADGVLTMFTKTA